MSRGCVDIDSEGCLRVSGELSFETVPRLWREAADLLGRPPELRIDLAGVSRADSAGLALMIEWMREADRYGKTIAFLNMPPQMLAIARVSSLDRVLPLELEPQPQAAETTTSE